MKMGVAHSSFAAFYLPHLERARGAQMYLAALKGGDSSAPLREARVSVGCRALLSQLKGCIRGRSEQAPQRCLARRSYTWVARIKVVRRQGTPMLVITMPKAVTR